MSAQPGIPVIVVTKREDDVEAVSRCLRNAGQPAHCQWVSDPRSLPQVLGTGRARLLCVCLNGQYERLTEAADHRDRHAPNLPILAIDDKVDEAAIARAIVDGARDLVTLIEPVRMSAVALRELSAYKTLRELDKLRAEHDALSEQLTAIVDETTAPMVYVAEGIIVNVNPAWLELFAYDNADTLVGTPILDIFARESRATIKGALMASAEGKWDGNEITVRALGSDGGTLSVRADLQAHRHDDEPCVRISMEPDFAPPVPDKVAHDHHPVTGLYLRKRFVTELEKFLDQPAKPGVTTLAYLKLDDMGEARDMLDPIDGDRLMLDLATLLAESSKPNDISGQFGGDIFMVLMSRGTLRDARAWAEDLRRSVASHLFEAGDKSISLTCTIGLAQLDPHADDANALMHKAQQAFRAGRDEGGNQVVVLEKDGTTDSKSAVPEELVKQALMKNGFRLVFQPVASMLGQSREMYDVLIRMRAPNGQEIMPADFLPTAQRAGLMKAIDRWVTRNAIGFCADRPGTQLFVRLSEESIHDATLIPWVEQQMSGTGAQARQLVFQITETHAEDHLKETRVLADALHDLGCSLAIEHFGVGHRPLQILEHIPVDIIKVDGSLMEGLTRNRDMQKKVSLYIESAKSRNIETIAERVEDANTMAVLWQLGIEFIQGYYVQGPEEIVLESA